VNPIRPVTHRNKQEDSEMLDLAAITVVLAAFVGPLVYMRWADRQDERATAVVADVRSVANRVLGGESVLAVNAVGARPWRHGQVHLSVPHGDQWLLDEVCGPVLRRVPTDFDLVVSGGEGEPAHAASGQSAPATRKEAKAA
jgi:hypothetical protein